MEYYSAMQKKWNYDICSNMDVIRHYHTKWNQSERERQVARKNINNLRYTDDMTLMEESEEELKCLLMKVKEESENIGLKLNIQKIKIMASSPITSWQIDGKAMETDFILGGLQNYCRWWLQP